MRDFSDVVRCSRNWLLHTARRNFRGLEPWPRSGTMAAFEKSTRGPWRPEWGALPIGRCRPRFGHSRHRWKHEIAATVGLQNEENGLISFFVTRLAATSTASAEGLVLAGQPGPVAACIVDRTSANGWHVDLEQTEAGNAVTASSLDGRIEWSVSLSRLQAFQSVSLASITYGTIARDVFRSDVWPVVEDCQATKN